MEAGVISKWRVKEGDLIKAGEAIADVDTDKANVAWESNDDGKIEFRFIFLNLNFELNIDGKLLLGKLFRICC
jgi:pyruvate carboxylase